MLIEQFKRYLATGEAPVATQDAAPKHSSVDLAAHDRRFHPNGFDPKKDHCNVRAALASGDISDTALAKAEKNEEKDSVKVGDVAKSQKDKNKTRKNETVLADVEKDGWRYVALKSDESYSDNFYQPDYKFCSVISRASDGRYAMRPSRNNHVAESDHISKFLKDPQKFVKDWNLFEFDDEYKHQVNGDHRLNPDFIAKPAQPQSSATLGDPERGRQAIIDGPGAGYLATLEREVAAGKTEGLEKDKERCRHYIENGKDDAEKQLHRDALAFLEELGKKAKADGSAAGKTEEKKPSPENKIPSDAEIEEAAKATSKAFHYSKQGVKNKIINMLKGIRVFDDHDGSLLNVVMAMKGKGSVVQAIKARAKEQFIPEDHPWFERKYWEEYDAELALRNKLAKDIEEEYKKYNLKEKTGQTVEAFVSQFIDDAKADGFTVSEKSVDLLRQRMNGLKKTPDSKAYEPRFDISRESLWGFAKTDPDAKEAARLASSFNRKAGWGFSEDDVQAYTDAFKDMDAGKFPYGLPEFEGKVNEKNFNEGDFSKESKDFRDLVKICASRPDLIRPFIVERLTDANFHSEAKKLAEGDYKKGRGKPTMDAIDRYLKEVNKEGAKE